MNKNKNPEMIAGRRNTLLTKVKAQKVRSPSLNILKKFSCNIACDFRSMLFKKL